MSTLTLTHANGEVMTAVGSENPYTEGPLLSERDALEIAEWWRDQPTDGDIVRHVKLIEGSAIVCILHMEGEITVDVWYSATEFHNFETGENSVDGEGAYGMSEWPFRGTIDWEHE